MKRSYFIFFLLSILITTSNILAQNAEPTATPPNEIIEEDGDVVKITTTLIQIDVVVTDKKGRQVTNLKPEDFEIYENGKKQEITNFSYITNKNADKNTTNIDQNSTDEFSLPAPRSKLKLEQVRRTYALVVDDLGLSFENVATVKYSLRNFVNKEMQNGDLVAIVRTGGGMGALQSFTSDKRQLLAAIDGIKWNLHGRARVSAFANSQRSFEDKEGISSKGLEEDKKDTDEDSVGKNDDFRNSNFAVGSLGALSYVIKGMKNLPGRKSVMFFSEGFNTLRIDEGRSTLIQGKRVYNRILGDLRNIAELANRSSVVLYTLDPRGLINPGAIRPEGAIGESKQEVYLKDSQQTLKYLAKETGGIAYVDQNRLERGLRQAVEDQSGYYLIAYEPDSETFDENKSKFNKLKVKVIDSKYDIRYRSGFYGISDETVDKTKRTKQEKIYDALISPFGATGVNLSLYSLFANDKDRGTFIRSLLSIDPKDLVFEKAENNMRKANFDVVAMTFGENGVPVDEFARNYTFQISEKDYQKMLEKGFVYNLFVPIKKAGAYQFRIALRDTKTDKIGSASQFIQIPNLDKDRLNISSIVLTAFTREQVANKTPKSRGSEFSDTARREFSQGTTLRYDYVIYNAAKNPKRLRIQAKLFRDGKLLLQGEPSDLDSFGQNDPDRIETSGAITLGKDLKPGSYILQILVKDENARQKYSIATQIIDFEIFE